MDVDNEGFISVGSFVVAVDNSTALGDSFKRQTTKRTELGQTLTSQRTNKWSKM